MKVGFLYLAIVAKLLGLETRPEADIRRRQGTETRDISSKRIKVRMFCSSQPHIAA